MLDTCRTDQPTAWDTFTRARPTTNFSIMTQNWILTMPHNNVRIYTRAVAENNLLNA